MDIYQQIILDHYRNPRFRGTLSVVDIESELHNPSCGDSISWQGSVQEGHLIAIAFQGKGCVISQAVASLLAEYCHAKSLSFLAELNADAVTQLTGMQFGPVRLKCALLPLESLQKAVATYQKVQ